jgi:hypothetical protein
MSAHIAPARDTPTHEAGPTLDSRGHLELSPGIGSWDVNTWEQDMSTHSNLKWTNAGTKESPDWLLTGPIDEIRAAAAAGTVDIVKVQTVKVQGEYLQRGDVGAIRPSKSERKVSTKVDWASAPVVSVTTEADPTPSKGTQRSTRMVRSK